MVDKNSINEEIDSEFNTHDEGPDTPQATNSSGHAPSRRSLLRTGGVLGLGIPWLTSLGRRGRAGGMEDGDGCKSDQQKESLWTQIQKLFADDGAENDRFGWSVAVDGDTAIVGAYLDEALTQQSGSAYVFSRQDGQWRPVAKLRADTEQVSHEFGYSVDIDGKTAIVGAPLGTGNTTGTGSAFVFRRKGSQWRQTAKLVADDGVEGDRFGHSVSLDGDTAVVGTMPTEVFTDPGFVSEPGSAYVFRRKGTRWRQTAQLLPADNGREDSFGISVAVSGKIAVIGAPGDDDNGFLSGSAFIFRRKGTQWRQTSKLLADDGMEGDRFGNAVALNCNRAVIGAPGDGDNGFLSGSAYVFCRQDEHWRQATKLLADDGQQGDSLGSSVAVDDETAFVGAPGDDDNRGSAYVFSRMTGRWKQAAKLLADDGQLGDSFGSSVAVDDETAVVGAPGDDDQGIDSGSTYVFMERA